MSLKIAEVKEVAPSPDGSIVVKAAAAAPGQPPTDVEIAITTELAATVAIQLLATTAKARAERDGQTPALDILAAAVVASGYAEKVRIQLLLEKGTVLPVELPLAAAAALNRGLADKLANPES